MVISYPGLGLLTLEAARKQDVNLVMANLLLGSFIAGNLVADLLLKKLDRGFNFQEASRHFYFVLFQNKYVT